MSGLDAGRLVREARIAAGLSQRELAHRAAAARSVVSRVETGRTSPSTEMLEHLLNAAGYELSVTLTPLPVVDSHMLKEAARIRQLTPEQRLTELRDLSRFLRAARRV